MKADRYLGLDTGGTGIKWVVTDPDLAGVASGEVPTDPDHITVSLARVASAVGPQLGAEADLHRLAGMGMAVAGIVDPVEGRLGRSPNLPGSLSNLCRYHPRRIRTLRSHTCEQPGNPRNHHLLLLHTFPLGSGLERKGIDRLELYN